MGLLPYKSHKTIFSSFFSPPDKGTMRRHHLQTERELAPEPNPASTLILGLQSTEL